MQEQLYAKACTQPPLVFPLANKVTGPTAFWLCRVDIQPLLTVAESQLTRPHMNYFPFRQENPYIVFVKATPITLLVICRSPKSSSKYSNYTAAYLIWLRIPNVSFYIYQSSSNKTTYGHRNTLLKVNLQLLELN